MAWMRSGVRSPSAPQSFLLVAVVLFFGSTGAGCNTSSPSSPAKDSPRERVDAAPSTSATAAAGCTADADCRTWSSYCQEAPCVCRVLAANEAEPRCSGGGNVACFVDPCMNKAAACQDGRCVLVMRAPTQ